MMRTLAQVGAVLFVALAGPGCAYTVFAPPETVAFALPEGWLVGYRGRTADGGSVVEYVRRGESVERWSELVTVQQSFRMLGFGGLESAREVYSALVEQRERECPGSTVWGVLREQAGSVLYEWRAGPCLGWPPQHEVARLLDGTRDRFRIAYTAQVRELAPEVRARWIAILEAARIEAPGGP